MGKVPENELKRKIHFSHTYRHLKVDVVTQTLYLVLFVLPCFILFLFFYTWITKWSSILIRNLLLVVIPPEQLWISFSEFLPYFGGVYFVCLPTAIPSVYFILVNLVVALILLWICCSGNRLGHPLSIFFTIAIMILIIACVFFLFASTYFPYTASIYSELYVKQQVGIWLSFIIIIGIVTGFLGIGGVVRRIITFVVTMLYSFVFGIIRYLVFMYIVSNVSSLYMASLFFSLGPFFDFLYLVYFYGIYVDKMINVYDSEKGRWMWLWS
jgi:hypothetical protein